MKAILGLEIIGKGGKFKVEELAGTLLFYFSASWCPPCRQFTPILTDFYQKVNQSQKKLEIVFFSADKTEKDFEEYFDLMPWMALPFGDGLIEKAFEKYQIETIPELTLVDLEGNVINTNCRSEILAKGEKAYENWVNN